MRALAAIAAALVLVPAASALDVSAAPSRIAFGDPVVVTATGEGPIELELGPWTALGPPGTSVRDGITTVVQRVACLVEACVPGDGARSVPLPVARGDGRVSAVRIVVRPRVPPAAVAADKASYRRSTTLPPVQGHHAWLAALLLSSLALAGAAALALRPRRRRPQAGTQPAPDALARALRLLRESAGRPAPDRRRAADLAGRVAPAVGRRAGTVAWSRPDPAVEDVEELAGQIEELG